MNFWSFGEHAKRFSTGVEPRRRKGANGPIEGRPSLDLLSEQRESDFGVAESRCVDGFTDTFEPLAWIALAALARQDEGPRGAPVLFDVRQIFFLREGERASERAKEGRKDRLEEDERRFSSFQSVKEKPMFTLTFICPL